MNKNFMGFFEHLRSAMTWNMLWRDARSGELTVFMAAIVVAVLIVTSISLFAERLQKALVSEADVFLAANLVLQSPDPVEKSWLEFARPLRTAETVQFPSMVVSGSAMYLASVKAVSGHYPLVGYLEASDEKTYEGEEMAHGPLSGEAWVDNRLLSLLDIEPGGVISLGEKTFIVKKILTREPDSSSSYWSLGPRIMIALEDLSATRLIQPGSRVEYRYLFAGHEAAINNYAEWLKPQLQKRHRLITLQDGQPGLAQSLQKAERFLLLAGSLGVLLAAVAIAMAARRYSVRHFDSVAVMKTLGATPQAIGYLVIIHLGVILLLSVGMGLLGGEVIQHIFLRVMKEWLPVNLPSASIKPYGVGAITGVICVIVFAGPLLWQLRSISPLRVLRRDFGNEMKSIPIIYGVGALAIFLLMYFYSQNFLIALYVFGGTLFCGLVVSVFAWVLLGGARLLGMQAGSVWRLAIANLRRNQLQSVLQLVMFGLVIMFLFISLLIRGSVIQEWKMQLPEKTPNHFLINIAPWQIDSLQEALANEHLETAGLYPMVRGRLSEINGVIATTQVSESVDEVYRELNLTWSEALPEDNVLASGSWWPDRPVASGNFSSTEGCVSIESSLAKKLKVDLNDRLLFTIGDRSVSVRVCSVRELAWDRMRPNFYFIFEPGILDGFSATYITSFYLPPEKKLFLNSLLKRFPTITIFEVDEMLKRMQNMVNQVSRAIESVLGLILASGVLVLIASIQASLDQRMHENALLRALGAGRKVILGSLFIEFIFLGLGAGFMAALGAELTAWALQTQVFKMDYHFHAWLWWAGPLTGAFLIGVMGILACLKVVRVPPLRVLWGQL